MDFKFQDKRAVKLDKVLSPDFIPLFGGRPARTARIGKDDALDIKILLETTHDVGHFIAKL
jgi:hypothetical protein